MITGLHLYFIHEEHLDRNRHANNVRGHGCLFESSRERLLEERGLGADILRLRGLGLFVRRANYEFDSPVLQGDAVWVESQFGYAGGVRIKSTQRMFHNGEQVSRAEAEYAFVNIKTGKPVRPPADLVEELKD